MSLTFHGQSDGKFLVWDATCMDTFCNSNRCASAKKAGSRSSMQSLLREGKQESTSILTGRTASSQSQWKPMDQWAQIHCTSCVTSIGQRLKSATGELQSYIYLLQWLQVAIQTGNASSILGIMELTSELPDSTD